MAEIVLCFLAIILAFALDARARARRDALRWKREAEFQKKMYEDERDFWTNFIELETNKKIKEIRNRKHGHGLN